MQVDIHIQKQLSRASKNDSQSPTSANALPQIDSEATPSQGSVEIVLQASESESSAPVHKAVSSSAHNNDETAGLSSAIETAAEGRTTKHMHNVWDSEVSIDQPYSRYEIKNHHSAL